MASQLWSKRDQIDYALDRRATLVALFKGSASAMDACDADPYLTRAAQYHGEITNRDCPVCKKVNIRDLRYVFGDQLGQFSGRIKSLPELTEMQSEYGEFRVYTVEICMSCGWNHLIYSFLLGDGQSRKAPRRQHTLEDDDWKGVDWERYASPVRPDGRVKAWYRPNAGKDRNHQ